MNPRNFALRLMRLLILLMLGLSSHAQDFNGPTIISFSVSPTNINLSSENVTVVATLQASDVTGIHQSRTMRPYFSGGSPGISGSRYFSSWQLVSGTYQNGTFEAYSRLSHLGAHR